MKKLIKIGLIIICVMGITVGFLLLSGTHIGNNTFNGAIPVPTPVQAIESILPLTLKNVILGQTTESEIAQSPNVTQKRDLGNGYTAYDMGIADRIRPNEVVTQNGVAVSKRERLDQTSGQQLPTLAYYSSQYGQPDKTFVGSYFYGDNISYYIYLQKGVTIVTNGYTGQVYEVQFFIPVSLDTYMKIYGEDINQTPQAKY